MGFFSSKPKQQKLSKSNLKPASLTSPPNVYTSPAPQPKPSQNNIHHPATSQPHFNHSASSYHLPAPPAYTPTPQYQSSPPRQDAFNLGRFSNSMVDLAQDLIPTNTAALRKQLASSTNVASAAYDDIRTRFDSVMTLIDCESLSGHEKSLFLCQEPTPQNSLVPYNPQPPIEPAENTDRALGFGKKRSGDQKKKAQSSQTAHVAASVVSGNYFSKVELYANSKLPMNLPPLRL